MALNNLAFICLVNGRLAENLEYRTEALEVGDRTNDPVHHAFELTMIGQAQYFLGRLGVARELAHRGIDIVRGLSLSWYSVYPVLHAAWIAAAEGHWEEADAHLEESTRLIRPEDKNGAALLRTVSTELHLLRRNAAAALSLYEETALAQFYEWEPPYLCWACLEAGDDARALEAAARALEHPLNAEVHAVRGLIFARQGRCEDAEAEIRQALRSTREMGYRLAEGRSLYFAGLLHARERQTERARARFEEALSLFGDLGADGYVRFVSAALDDLQRPQLTRP